MGIGLFSGYKTAGAWSWPLSSAYRRVQLKPRPVYVDGVDKVHLPLPCSVLQRSYRGKEMKIKLCTFRQQHHAYSFYFSGFVVLTWWLPRFSRWELPNSGASKYSRNMRFKRCFATLPVNIWQYLNTNDTQTSWNTRVPDALVWASLISVSK